MKIPKVENNKAQRPLPKTENPTKDQLKIQELINDLQRTRADFENYRKQVEIQKEQVAILSKLKTLREILPILDDFDRAISSYPELSPLTKNIEKSIAGLGLKKIEAGIGVIFNADFHEAVLMEEGEGEKEVISELLRAGYMFNDELLRPAMVKVKRVE